MVLVLLLLTLLSMMKAEGWDATGLVSLTLITVVIMKLFGIVIAHSDLVQPLLPMSNERNVYIIADETE